MFYAKKILIVFYPGVICCFCFFIGLPFFSYHLHPANPPPPPIFVVSWFEAAFFWFLSTNITIVFLAASRHRHCGLWPFSECVLFTFCSCTSAAQISALQPSLPRYHLKLILTHKKFQLVATAITLPFGLLQDWQSNMKCCNICSVECVNALWFIGQCESYREMLRNRTLMNFKWDENCSISDKSPNLRWSKRLCLHCHHHGAHMLTFPFPIYTSMYMDFLRLFIYAPIYEKYMYVYIVYIYIYIMTYICHNEPSMLWYSPTSSRLI